MKLWVRFSSATKDKSKNEAKFRLIRHCYIKNEEYLFTYDIQERINFLFFHWWTTIDTGYKDVQKAQRSVLSLIAKEK